MPVTVVVGGQFGSEGKGKVAHFLAREQNAVAAVRVGGSNSGHTVIDSSGNPLVFRQLPTAAILPEIKCVISAGSYIEPQLLLNEIEIASLTPERVMIDPNAMLITEKEQLEEKNSLLRYSIGSTLSGTGAAVRKRIERSSETRLAKHEELLKPYIKPVVPFMRQCLQQGERIIIEGTQGFGLSLLHSEYYPYVTSRDTTAAAFVSEAGLSPLDVDDIVLVIRSFPIRVAGNSGDLPNEIDWETITHESGSKIPIIEYTSVTKAVRRVARFDPDVVVNAIVTNRPTKIVLNHLDYVDASCSSLEYLSDKTISFVRKIESLINAPINYFGFSPSSLIKYPQAIKIC
ncbi:MAG: adenylosuccinate synthetase [Xenococcaceae cyanobacterium MO_167.B27]|nr:adenylosuccinate synthetase [Xenococcaceae cyanobacterium MO_167.B27]